MIIVDRVNNLDVFEIQVEVRADYFSDEMGKMMNIKKKIAAKIHSLLGLNPDIKLVEPRTLERSEGKAVRVIDKRKL